MAAPYLDDRRGHSVWHGRQPGNHLEQACCYLGEAFTATLITCLSAWPIFSSVCGGNDADHTTGGGAFSLSLLEMRKVDS